MGSVKRLEQFWHNLVLANPRAKDIDGAVAFCYREVPIYLLSQVADVNVNDDEVENLLNRVIEYFSSKGSSYACFRTSPLTRPKWFNQFLENNGFERKEEQSVMMFKGKQVEDKLNPDVNVKKISQSEIDLWNEIFVRSFGVPNKWKEGWKKYYRKAIRKGMKCYLAYIEGKPVGTSCLWSSMKVGGIFSVGTLEEYRRRGIGTTLTVQALLDSMDEGNDLHTLQAENGGNAERLYEKIGFETDHTVSYFAKEIHGKK